MIDVPLPSNPLGNIDTDGLGDPPSLEPIPDDAVVTAFPHQDYPRPLPEPTPGGESSPGGEQPQPTSPLPDPIRPQQIELTSTEPRPPIPYGDDNRTPSEPMPPATSPELPLEVDSCLPPAVDFPPALVAPVVEIAGPAYAAEPAPQVDLELLDVRLVDSGFAADRSGPRLRVYYRNRGPADVTSPLAIALLASDGPEPTADMPKTAVQVEPFPAGETQQIDIRLPVESLTLATNGLGEPAPFVWLFAMIDSQQQYEESNETNNVLKMERTRIRLVDLKVVQLEPAAPVSGGPLVLVGEGFGRGAGQVQFDIGGLKLRATVETWMEVGARVRVPEFAESRSIPAKVTVIRSDDQSTDPLTVRINPKP